MTEVLQKKLAQLPKSPGVYFHKDSTGETIYIGKAAVLRNRVRQYFQKSRTQDPKTDALVRDIADISWTETETELDALFLEAELIRRYMPRYNILLRDDKSLTYVRISFRSQHPTVTMTRRPLDDGATYFGPYFSAVAVRRALKYLRKAFPYSTHIRELPKRACLQVQLGLCPGLESNKTTLEQYRKNLRQLMRYLRGERTALMRQIERDMKNAAAGQDYESAVMYRNQLQALKQLGKQIIFSDKESVDISKDEALYGLSRLLSIKPPRRIEGYDISHMQGTDTVASMVVFINGLPEKSAYRKFKMRLPGNDDFLHMAEVIRRRFSQRRKTGWDRPSLCVIDGGKGQLHAALQAQNKLQDMQVPMIGLAKRFEEIIVHNEMSGVYIKADMLKKIGGDVVQSGDYSVIHLPDRAHIIKLLQRIRDESHRFAVSYHTTLKRKRTTVSKLDDMPGIGPSSKKKLLRAFGSVKAISEANTAQITAIVGSHRAKIIKQHLD
jgi:excinuclease ABC subunit C